MKVYLIKIDAINKLIQKFKVTGASEHNSIVVDDLLDEDDKGRDFMGSSQSHGGIGSHRFNKACFA